MTTMMAQQREVGESYGSDDQRWEAVRSRDRRADGAFVYAVRTTGVYCRPACAVRRARRENVAFYASPADAERAGFRACRRCDPHDSAGTDRHARAVAEACRTIAKISADGRALDPGALAHAAGMSRSHFQRMFKAFTGLTPRAYAMAHRSACVRQLLADGQSVTRAMYDAGFNSSARFYAAAPGILGMTPSAFRSGGAGAVLRFAVGQTFLGAVLVAATERGICSITLGDDPALLVRELQDRFPRAELIGGDRDFERFVACIVTLVEHPRARARAGGAEGAEGAGEAAGVDGAGVGDAELPLDIQGTAFQQRIWQKLREIPLGSTRTYADIARSIGAPSSVRAVAGACAANPLAVVIPCHRVVRTDGSLSGYRWGIERKAKLLERERGDGRGL